MKKRTFFSLLAGLMIGLFLGALWHWMWIFPFPELSTWRSNLGKQPTPSTGRWLPIPRAPAGGGLSEQQQREIQRLEAIGYLSGSRAATDRSDVTLHDEQRAFQGFNLIVSGHGPEAILTDMSGRTIHTWRRDISDVWPDFEPDGEDNVTHTYWRRVHLFPNGDLLAIFGGIGVIKVDKDSRLRWSVRNAAHHDLDVAPDGKIYLLTRQAHINPAYNAEKPILEDYVTVLSAKGEHLKSVSILRLLENSPYAPILRRLESHGNILHTNTIEVLANRPTEGPCPFNPDHLLISVRQLDLVAVVDLQAETLVWAESDLWHRQHQPTLLPNGNLLVFDNRTTPRASTVLELDPGSRIPLWSYRGTESHPFFTENIGSCQRLANGNTLITESEPGRAFELTSDKEIVWEYISPHRAGDHDQLVATLFEVIRLPPDVPLDWLP